VSHAEVVRPQRVVIETEAGWDRFYAVWYIPEFPIQELGYGGNRPLWKYTTDRDWRAALREDFRVRGQINPCVVWNHNTNGHDGRIAGESYANYVKIGRNKCWCARELGWRSVKALYTTNRGARPDGRMDAQAVRTDPEMVTEYWKDGTLKFLVKGLLSHGCTDPARLQVPRGT
jgi:hypothetical protein